MIQGILSLSRHHSRKQPHPPGWGIGDRGGGGGIRVCAALLWILRQIPNMTFQISQNDMWIGVFMRCTGWCKNIPARFWEWLLELLHCTAILGWAAEHLSDSQNLAGMFLHNSVNRLRRKKVDILIELPEEGKKSQMCSWAKEPELRFLRNWNRWDTNGVLCTPKELQ